MTGDPLKDLWKDKGTWSKAQAESAFEQYKLYVEMADHISDRRDKANSFFLTLNTGVLAAIGFLWDKQLITKLGCLLVFPLLALLAFCVFWYRLVKAYRQLTTQKFKLIGIVEQRLPVRLWGTEWKMLGEGRDTSLYTPLSGLEENVPLIFGLVYVGLSLFAWLGG